MLEDTWRVVALHEDIPDKKLFLAHLLKKAGLAADTRLTRCKVSRYRVSKWKE